VNERSRFRKNSDCRLLKGLRGEARERSTSGGVLRQYVGASRLSATKHMSLFQQPARQPRFSGISHVSLPCRDLEESKIFYANVMGGKLVHSIQGLVEFRIEYI